MVLIHGLLLVQLLETIRNLEYDILITGRQAVDGDTAQVGPQIAEHLGIPVISYAQEITVEGQNKKTVTVKDNLKIVTIW